MATYIKGNAVENATSYELLEKASDGAYASLATAEEINFEVSALSLAAGDHTLVVKAKADGYSDSDYSNEVVYTVEAADGEWEVYSQDGAATVTVEEGIPTVTGTTGKALVLIMNTSKSVMFAAPTASASDGGKMVIIGRYDENVLAIRVRGDSTGTQLQRYSYTTFSGAAVSTNAEAVNTFATGDLLAVVWSGSTVSLYVNGIVQSSFDCSTYMAYETWQKCTGWLETAAKSATTTLSGFTLTA